jgi:flagellum-specific peptidoglycan hydrolase FlgJ
VGRPGRWKQWIAVLTVVAVGATVTASPGATAPATGTPLVGQVSVAGDALNVREAATTASAVVRILPHGTAVHATCQVVGEKITGSQRTTNLWNRISDSEYVSDAFVAWPAGRASLPPCARVAAPMPTSNAGFVSWAGSMAQDLQAVYRVPASVTVAQAILESGWGRSGLSRDGNNLFGMKCFGHPGEFASGCRSIATTECGRGECYGTRASFRVYPDAWASFADHAHALTLQRYRKALDYADNANAYAHAIHQAGYATSPSYANDLIDLMRTYDLYRFDRA